MAFATGAAGNINDLLTALQNSCTANGWTLTNGVLASGDCHLKASVSAAALALSIGLGDDGNGNLTSPAPGTTVLSNCLGADPIVYPVVWFAHVTATEVYFVVNFSVDRYIMCAFGQSPVPGLPGKGVWVNGSGAGAAGTLIWNSFFAGQVIYNGYTGTGLFYCGQAFNGSPTWSYFHHGLDNGGWSQPSDDNNGVVPSFGGAVKATIGAIDLMTLFSPSTWSGEPILVPVQPAIGRPSGFVSVVGELVSCRYVRLDNLDAGQIITIGTDRWKIYPFYRKNASARNPGNGSVDSGTLGLAIHYDGP